MGDTGDRQRSGNECRARPQQQHDVGAGCVYERVERYLVNLWRDGLQPYPWLEFWRNGVL